MKKIKYVLYILLGFILIMTVVTMCKVSKGVDRATSAFDTVETVVAKEVTIEKLKQDSTIILAKETLNESLKALKRSLSDKDGSN